MRENKGFSLVELLVGIAIAAIVAGSIGFLLTTSLRMYNKETVDVTLQQELQVTVNQIMDYAMESETIVADFDGNYPDYLALGKFKSKSGTKADDKTTIDSQIIWLDGNKLYLKKAEITDFCLSTDPDNADYRKINVDKITDLIPDEGASEDINLLAQYVKDFGVSEVGGIANITDEAGNVTGQGYENPLSLILSIEFEKTAATANRGKRVEDTVYLRNRVTNDIYVNIAPDQLDKTYSLVEDKSVSIETTTVEMEKQSGIIQIPGSDNGGTSEDLNILEIVPDYSYDYVQYVIGGEDGALLNTANTTYGASAAESGYSPITSAELEGFLVQTAGSRENNHIGFGSGSFYPNNADLPAIYYSKYENKNVKPRVGYYEYVGEENGGVYAIDKIDSAISLANNPGEGDSRPKVVCFTQDYYDNDKEHLTGKYYNPIFEYVDYDDGSNEYYVPDVVYGARPDYKRVYEHIVVNEYYQTDKFLYYEYVGEGNGDVALKFKRYNYNAGEYNSNAGSGFEYKVKGDVNAYFDPDGGDYYMYYDGWDTRSDTNSKVDGFDYNQYVTDAALFSKKYTVKPQKSTDYGWVWRDISSGELYDDIVNENIRTSAGLINSGGYADPSLPVDKRRIYLKDHYRVVVVNNEVFKLFVMQDVLESYTPGNMLDISCGVWDIANDKYCEINKNAISSWEKSGHKINLDVRIPSDLKTSDIENADLIIFGAGGQTSDGGFNFANTLYKDIRGTAGDGAFSSSNDITFSQAVAIYKKVIKEEAAIACPTELNTGGVGYINIGKLYQMLYGVVNDDIEKEDIIVDTYEIPKKQKIDKQGEDNNYWTVDSAYQSEIPNKIMLSGSGRDIFTDYLKSMSSEALSKPLYEMEIGGLSRKTTDFIYVEESGPNIGSMVVPATNEEVDGYEIKHDRSVMDAWGNIIELLDGKFVYFDSKVGDNRNYMIDRYVTGNVWNPEYNHFYKFRYESPSDGGIYRNQFVWNNDSSLLHYRKTGSGGILALQTIKNNTKNGGEEVKADIIGTINYVGADLEEAGDERRANQGDTASKQFSDMPDYSMKIVDLPDYTSDPSKQGSVITRKVLYMTEEQFEEAQKTGLYLYVLIKTSKDPSNYNKCVLRYEKNEKDAQGKPEQGRVDYEDYNYDEDNNENHHNCIKYAAGVNADEKFVREYRYHVPAEYFQHLVPPYNNKNNMIVARIDKSATRQYEGNDTLYIYIRDTFDLD